jgi:hypothetical protein
LKLIPSHLLGMEGELVGLVGFGLLAAGWALLPFWGTDSRGRGRFKAVTGAGLALVVYFLTFTILGYVK